MKGYRCFFLNKGGRIEKAEIIKAEADEDALIAAFKLLERESKYSTIEVWEGARKVFPQSMDGADIEQLKRMLLAASVIITEDPTGLH